MQLTLRALVIAAAVLAPSARAEMHLGPQIAFNLYHRNAPEETDSTRLSALLVLKFDTSIRGLTGEVATSYENGLDTFATQNSVNDRVLRGRLGIIYNPFNFSFPLAGFRIGTQYSAVQGIYNTNSPVSTDTLHPHFWSPYFGFVLGVFPESGFGVEAEYTMWYDQYFRSLIFQLGFGVDVF